ncbi:MAG: SUMF1/EgtB/PvdO family nonheme iron enzyme [Gemmatimonadota bacterium]
MRRAALAVSCSILILACGGGDGGSDPTGPREPPPPPPVASVTVSPPSATVRVGSTQQFTVTLKDAEGNELTGRAVTWTSSNTSVATVGASTGLATGVAVGTATVTATSEGQSGNEQLAVLASSVLGPGFGAEQFSLIPAGTFQMGSANGPSDEQPVHTVNITEPFYMQKTEVTQGQWKAVMGSNPSFFTSCGDDCPVERVSWDDIQGFLQALNAADPGKDYRLPTEAEWEYAARAGTTGDYGGTGNLDDMGWYEENAGGRTHGVAQKQANAWDLYDMHGNVTEWVQDWYSDNYYSVSPANDPPGPNTGTGRVLRGGPWNGSPEGARSAWRALYGPSLAGVEEFGFRLVRTP